MKNRTIKFRVWDNLDNVWIDPSHLQVNRDGSVYIPYDLAPKANQTRFVIQQCSGLKDKNGQDIYEGDVVSLLTPVHGKPMKDAVEFDEGQFQLKDTCHPLFDALFYGSCEAGPITLEVVGNAIGDSTPARE